MSLAEKISTTSCESNIISIVLEMSDRCKTMIHLKQFVLWLEKAMPEYQ
jgi:hypothetical protein